MKTLLQTFLMISLLAITLVESGCEQRSGRATARLALGDNVKEDDISAEMSIIRSAPFLKLVFDQLLTDQLQRLDQSTSDEMTEENRKVVFKRFYRRVSITRVGATRVLVISFTHPDTDLAADIANKICDTYLGIPGKRGRVTERAVESTKTAN